MKHHSVLNSNSTSLHISLRHYIEYITTFLLLAISHILSVLPIKTLNYLPVMQPKCKYNVDTDNNDANDFSLNI